MPPRNNLRFLAYFLIVSLGAWAQGTAPGNPAPQAGTASPPAAGSQAQSSAAPQASPQTPDTGGEGGTFVFHTGVEEVVLHATVIDDKDHIITDLEKSAFTVYEDGKPQIITSFRHEDIPVAMGIVIDNSGSMREKRDRVNKAALNLVRASNPQDQVFIVNFNDEYYLDQDFTSNIAKLREALEKVEARGGTALYDALVASADHLSKNAKLQKKVLFVITDGEDNASQENLEEAVHHLQQENGPTVYAIGILGEERAKRARRALQTLAERTGGSPFCPGTQMKSIRSAAPWPTTFAISTPLVTSRQIPRVRADIARYEWRRRRLITTS